MIFSPDKLALFDELLAAADSVVITAHKSPDGDSVGSSLGLHHYLAKLGVKAVICHPDEAPEFLWWMPGYPEIINYEERSSEVEKSISHADVIFCLDYNAPGRIGKMDDLLINSSAKRIMIDHHRDPDLEFCDLIFSDPANSSTSQLIYELMESRGHLDRLNQEIATPLYCGIIMDTGSFRFGSSTPKTHQVAADLIKAGVKHWEVHESVFDSNTEDRIRMTSYALLEKLVIRKEFSTSYISLLQSEQERFNAKKGDTEGLVNQALAIAGIQMAVFFMESDGLIKLSFRSKGDIPVNDLAREYFEGGGHRNAAGGKFLGKMADAIDRFERVLPGFHEVNRDRFSKN